MRITEIHFDSIDSTQSYAKRKYASFSPDAITCISAEEQTQGYGRYRRKWVSPKGVNLYVTFCFHLPLNTPDLSSLAIVMAYSFASLLLSTGLQAKIKWPNDVQLSGKKVSGILCETVFQENWIQIFLAIGINVNMDKADLDGIDQPATSLKNETGRQWDRKSMLKQFQDRFSVDLDRFKKEGFSPFHLPAEHLLAHKGETIRCFDGKKEWFGICHSLGKDGRLNLLLRDGTLHPLLSGDVIA